MEPFKVLGDVKTTKPKDALTIFPNAWKSFKNLNVTMWKMKNHFNSTDKL